jgi:hypothetical protein
MSLYQSPAKEDFFMVTNLVYKFQMICFKGNLSYWMETWEICIFQQIKGHNSRTEKNQKLVLAFLLWPLNLCINLLSGNQMWDRQGQI